MSDGPRIAVVTFPGSNDDGDAALALEFLGAVPVRVWHADAALPEGTEGVILPGGFSYGDYLRCGAIARFAPVMESVSAFAGEGGPGARHLQRLPDPLRGGAAAGRAPPQPPAAVPLRRRDRDGREHDERVRRRLVGGRRARDPDQARRGQLVRRPRSTCRARGERADRVPLHARTSTAPSTGSRASRTRPATSSA